MPVSIGSLVIAIKKKDKFHAAVILLHTELLGFFLLFPSSGIPENRKHDF
jgi:hypothetical protein